MGVQSYYASWHYAYCDGSDCKETPSDHREIDGMFFARDLEPSGCERAQLAHRMDLFRSFLDANPRFDLKASRESSARCLLLHTRKECYEGCYLESLIPSESGLPPFINCSRRDELRGLKTGYIFNKMEYFEGEDRDGLWMPFWICHVDRSIWEPVFYREELLEEIKNLGFEARSKGDAADWAEPYYLHLVVVTPLGKLEEVNLEYALPDEGIMQGCRRWHFFKGRSDYKKE